MKALFVVAAFALMAAVSADQVFNLTAPSYACVFTFEAEITSLLTYKKVKVWVNKNYTRLQNINKQDVLIYDQIYRPDLIFRDGEGEDARDYITSFSYQATLGCHDDHDSMLSSSYGEDIYGWLFDEHNGLDSVFWPVFYWEEFQNKTRADFDGKTYDVYYDLDMDAHAYYVDDKGFIVAIVTDNDIPDKRTQYVLKYDNRAAPEDFTFDKDFVYNCTDPAIFDAPSISALICAASATKAVFAIILASLLIALF